MKVRVVIDMDIERPEEIPFLILRADDCKIQVDQEDEPTYQEFWSLEEFKAWHYQQRSEGKA